MSASIWGESLTILENAAILKELVEKYGVESEGGKNLDLCEDAMLLPTIFDEPTQLIVQRLRVFGDFIFLTDKEDNFIINLEEDDENPGHELLIYENILFRKTYGPGYSEVGECEDVDPYDIQIIVNIAKQTVGE
jgi:hypothetical protein